MFEIIAKSSHMSVEVVADLHGEPPADIRVQYHSHTVIRPDRVKVKFTYDPAKGEWRLWGCPTVSGWKVLKSNKVSAKSRHSTGVKEQASPGDMTIHRLGGPRPVASWAWTWVYEVLATLNTATVPSLELSMQAGLADLDASVHNSITGSVTGSVIQAHTVTGVDFRG